MDELNFLYMYGDVEINHFLDCARDEVLGKIMVKLHEVDILDAGFCISVYGVGDTIQDAAIDYIKKVKDKTLIFNCGFTNEKIFKII